MPSQPPTENIEIDQSDDRTIERFEELLYELQHIFLDIFSNFRREPKDP